jgi:acetyl esterase/lipase
MPRWLAVVWTVVLGGCSDVVVESDIAYDDRFAVAKLDVYSPPRRETPRPAVIVIHGGGWREDSNRDFMAMHSERFARAGYVAFNIEYRGTPGAGAFPGAVQDTICALAWVRANADRFGIDPDRIASYGYSAGGHLASMLGVAATSPIVAPDCAAGSTGPVAAVISGAGPQDMRLFPEVEAITDFLGGSEDEVPDNYTNASPIHHVAPGAPPFLFITGDDDWFVDIEHSRKMKAALADAGSEGKLFVIPGGGHLLNRSPSGQSWDVAISLDTPEAWAATIDFLDHTIGGDL